MSGKPSKKFDPNEQRQQAMKLNLPKIKRQTKQAKTKSPQTQNVSGSFSYSTFVANSPSALDALINTSSLLNSLGNSQPMANKFKPGDIVRVTYKYHDWTNVLCNVLEFRGGYYTVEALEDSSNGEICVGEKGTWSVEWLEFATASKVDFDSVVMSDTMRQQILEALVQIDKQELIFTTWNFAATVEKGRGVSMLFWGPPGTGKTLTGQAIADKVGGKLVVVGTADLQSSEPGQAERNIREIFKKNKGKNNVILFDECDGLIFDRTATGPILGAQVNELLASLEKYDGITIFTTNRIDVLDEAVNRRLALKLEFAMPDQTQRTEIWKRMFPAEAPLADNVDFSKLASIEIAGGHIKNAVLRAARIAAAVEGDDKKKKITQTHLVTALQQEGRSMVEFQMQKKKFNVARLAGMTHTESGGLAIDRSMQHSLERIEHE